MLRLKSKSDGKTIRLIGNAMFAASAFVLSYFCGIELPLSLPEVAAHGLMLDCSNPKNMKSIFHSEIPTNSTSPFIAKITIIRSIAFHERERLLLRHDLKNEPKQSLLARVDSVVTGSVSPTEIEVWAGYSCINASDLNPGASGILVSEGIQDASQTWKVGSPGEIWITRPLLSPPFTSTPK